MESRPASSSVCVRSRTPPLFRRYLPEARLLGLIPAQADIERFVAAGATVIRLWPKWLGDKTLAPRVTRAGAGLLIAADNGTPEEVIPLLELRPVFLFTNDPARLARTLAELRAAR